MGKFGWSLPPGVSTLPGEESHPCETCGLGEDDCICPECPVCGESGNTYCYEKKHLTYNKKQLLGQAQMKLGDLESAVAEQQMYIDWLKEQPDDYTQ